MEKDRGYATVDSIVMGALADRGELGTHLYDRYLHWALEALQDFHMDSAQEVKTVFLSMNDIKQAELPGDFVDYTKIGMMCGGRIKTLSVAENLNTVHLKDDCDKPKPFEDCACTVNSLPIDLNIGGYYYFNVNANGENLGALYGYGGGYNRNGYFKIDKSKEVWAIQFSSEVNNVGLIMEYISTGFNPCDQSVVNQYAKKLIKLYIHWMSDKFKFGAHSGQAQASKQEYYDEYSKVLIRVADFNIRDFFELSRRNIGQAPKF